jgi:hypothetical protein
MSNAQYQKDLMNGAAEDIAYLAKRIVDESTLSEGLNFIVDRTLMSELKQYVDWYEKCKNEYREAL